MASGLEFNIFVNVQKRCPRKKRKVVITAVYVRKNNMKLEIIVYISYIANHLCSCTNLELLSFNIYFGVL